MSDIVVVMLAFFTFALAVVAIFFGYHMLIRKSPKDGVELHLDPNRDDRADTRD